MSVVLDANQIALLYLGAFRPARTLHIRFVALFREKLVLPHALRLRGVASEVHVPGRERRLDFGSLENCVFPGLIERSGLVHGEDWHDMADLRRFDLVLLMTAVDHDGVVAEV